MAKKTNPNTKPNTEVENERPSYTVKATIDDVMQLSNISTKYPTEPNRSNRLQFVVDTEFEGIDAKTSQVIQTNSFGLSSKRIVEQCGKSIPALKLAKVKALGREVNPQIIALAMLNADIEFLREFYDKGENVPQYDNKPTSQPIWVTTITKIVPHIDPLFLAELMELIKTAPAIELTETTAAPKTFAVAGLD